jgi:hypothetical protein
MEKYKIRYVVLAKSIPEYSKRDGTLYTCSIGYSPELGLIRVYPLPVVSMNKWDLCEFEVERNKYDSRVESWKLSSYSRKENWTNLSDDVKIISKVKPEYVINQISQYIYPSVKFLNSQKKSVGLIYTKDYNIYWDSNSRYINDKQLGLFEDVEVADFTKYTKETKNKEARITFKDNEGEHDIQFNEWQVYEYQRKFNASDDAFRFMVGKNLLLVGNMHNYRNIWIVLSVFNINTPQIFNIIQQPFSAMNSVQEHNLFNSIM